jgi:hypothetical protein
MRGCAARSAAKVDNRPVGTERQRRSAASSAADGGARRPRRRRSPLARLAAEARALVGGLRWSYLPPLMVYFAAGISGLTSIVGTFFVKEQLGLSAAFLASLTFWAGLPWVLKVPLGHLVDLFWRWKALMVWAGASLIAASLLIMVGLLADPDAMRRWMSIETWYVWSSLLGPVGYVMQDVVADAMTVEAVPRVDLRGRSLDERRVTAMHTTMQTLGRIAVVGGSLAVSIVNVTMLRDMQGMTPAERDAVFLDVYRLSLAVPVVSVLGVLLSGWQKRRAHARFTAHGLSAEDAARHASRRRERPPANPWMLLGGALFAVVSVAVGLADTGWGEETIFAVSLVVIGVLMWRLLRELPQADRSALLTTAMLIWVFRATPSAGPGVGWWMIDALGFDEAFLAKLSLTGEVVAIAALLGFRRFMAERSIQSILVVLTLAWTALALPMLGMAHGLHEWTAARTGGVVDARLIALVNTALESPLGQVAAVPMLAWVARCAPERLKATFFAVMVSFTNLALAAGQLGTKWLNRLFVVTREVRDESGTVTVPADYERIGDLLATTTALGLVLPLAAVGIAKLVQQRRRHARGASTRAAAG